jgi:hypothetical protein
MYYGLRCCWKGPFQTLCVIGNDLLQPKSVATTDNTTAATIIVLFAAWQTPRSSSVVGSWSPT